MTWGRVVDTRRTLTRLCLIILLAIVTLFICISLLVSVQLLAPAPLASEIISMLDFSP
jgi:hypothetical protein